MSVNDDTKIEVLRQMHDEYMYIHKHLWSVFYRGVGLYFVLSAAPFLYSEKFGKYGALIIFFPFLALIVACVLSWFVDAEYIRAVAVRKKLLALRGHSNYIADSDFAGVFKSDYSIGTSLVKIILYGGVLLSIFEIVVILTQV